MEFEVDFLAVGENEKSGDAIALRYGNLKSGNKEDFTVVVIDGGYQANGEDLVNHINKYYGTNKVDVVVSTHADNDHLGGLGVILEKMEVGQLWMHLPWKHTEDIARMFKNGRVTDNSVKDSLRKSLEAASDLEKLAQRKKVPINEPFTGLQDPGGCLVVVGPTKDFYESLLPGFRGTPEPKDASLLQKFLAKGEEAIKWVLESLHIETLTDEGETTPENNTSAILLLRVDDQNLLFTADAGIPALTLAADILEKAGYDYSKINFVQVPHHGSQRNVGPTILNRLVGPKQKEDKRIKSAFVSVSKKGAPKHPCKKVTNAFRRRGAPVVSTNDSGKYYFHNMSLRPGWSTAEPLPFYTEVEE